MLKPLPLRCAEPEPRNNIIIIILKEDENRLDLNLLVGNSHSHSHRMSMARAWAADRTREWGWLIVDSNRIKRIVNLFTLFLLISVGSERSESERE